MKILSTNIGERKTINWKGKEVTTGIYKYPTNFAIFLDVEDVKDDAVCDRKYHGGINQAVYAYSFDKYDFWKEKYPNLDWQFGMFGENLTVDFLDETKINVGDTFTLGETILEATLQRSPCMKLGIRFNDMKIVKQFWNTTFCGVYFKVLQTGNVTVGDEFIKIKSYPENPTIADLLLKRKAENGL
jgi:MOSC domain-containing protein YiiM